MKIDAHRTFGTRECPSCACEVPSNCNRCPICTYLFPTLPAGRKTAIRATALVVLAVFLWWLLR